MSWFARCEIDGKSGQLAWCEVAKNKSALKVVSEGRVRVVYKRADENQIAYPFKASRITVCTDQDTAEWQQLAKVGDKGSETSLTKSDGKASKNWKSEKEEKPQKNKKDDALKIQKLLDSFEQKSHVCFVDGSHVPNKGAASAALLIVDASTCVVKTAYLGAQTNNVAELYAVSLALDLLQGKRADQWPMEILCDSQYVVGALQGGNRAQANVELIDMLKSRLADEQARRRVLLHWIPGHSGCKGSEDVDAMAKSALNSVARVDVAAVVKEWVSPKEEDLSAQEQELDRQLETELEQELQTAAQKSPPSSETGSKRRRIEEAD